MQESMQSPWCPQNSSSKQKHEVTWNSFLLTSSLQEAQVFLTGPLSLVHWSDQSPQKWVCLYLAPSPLVGVLREAGSGKGDWESPSGEAEGCGAPRGWWSSLLHPPKAAQAGQALLPHWTLSSKQFLALMDGQVRQHVLQAGILLSGRARDAPAKGPLTSWFTHQERVPPQPSLLTAASPHYH